MKSEPNQTSLPVLSLRLPCPSASSGSHHLISYASSSSHLDPPPSNDAKSQTNATPHPARERPFPCAQFLGFESMKHNHNHSMSLSYIDRYDVDLRGSACHWLHGAAYVDPVRRGGHGGSWNAYCEPPDLQGCNPCSSSVMHERTTGKSTTMRAVLPRGMRMSYVPAGERKPTLLACKTLRFGSPIHRICTVPVRQSEILSWI